MSNYTFKGTADFSQHDSVIRDSAKQVNDYGKTVDNASKSVNDFTKAENMSVKELQNQLSQLESVGRHTSNFRKQLGQVTRQLSDLTVCYRKMTNEEKNSPLGRATAQKIAELQKVAGDYKDTMVDVQQEITRLASDTGNWDAMKGSIDLASNSLQGMVAIMSLTETESEALVQVIARLGQIQAVTNAAIAIGNALQKQSAVMLGVAAVQEKALAVAKNLGTKSTIAATVAQKAFNLVAYANPYVLLAMAIVGVVAALASFVSSTNESTEAERKHQAELERTQKAIQHMNEKVGESTGNILADYKLLQAQWKALSSDHERARWVEENKGKFNAMGLAVNSVADAEKVLVAQTGAVVKALKARAEAEAYAELYKEQIKNKAVNDANGSVANGRYRKVAHTGDQIDAATRKAAGLTDKDFNYYNNVGTTSYGMAYNTRVNGGLNESGKKKMDLYYQKEALKIQQQETAEAKKYGDMLEKAYTTAIEEEKKLGKLSTGVGGTGSKQTGGKSGGKSGGNKEETQLQKMEAQLSKYKKELENIPPVMVDTEAGQEKIKSLNNAIEKQKKLIKDYKIQLGIETDETKLQKLERELKELKQDQLDLDIEAPDFDKTLAEIDNKIKAKEKEVHEYKVKIGVEEEDSPIAKLEKELSELEDKRVRLDVDSADFKTQLETIQAQITSKTKEIERKKIQLGIEPAKGPLQEVQDEIEALNNQLITIDINTAEGLAKVEELKKQIKDKLEQEYQINVKLGVTGGVGSLDFIDKQLQDKQAQLKITTDPQSRKQILEDIEVLQTAMDKMTEPGGLEGFANSIGKVKDNISSCIEPITGVVDAWQSFSDACEDGNGWEVFKSLYSAIMESVGAFQQIIQVINMFKTASKASQAVENANTAQKVANQNAENASTAAGIAVDSGKAISGATASGASMPFPLNLVAIAAGIAAVIAAIAMIASFKNGGVVPRFDNGGIFSGATSLGDMNLARVNGGEMILNGTQQAKLFRMLNGSTEAATGSGGGQVEFKLKGDTLYGALKNYSKTAAKSGLNTGIK